MSEQARIDELALQLAEGIINTLSNATMPAPQRKARCQVLIAEALASERNDLKLQLEEKQCEKDALRLELSEWKTAAEHQLSRANQYSAENRINQDIIVSLQKRIEEMEESVPPVYTEVVNERRRQDEQWGGPEHDDTHALRDWKSYIEYQSKCLLTKRVYESSEFKGARIEPTPEFRERLIKIAALAIAAVESYDRKAPVYKLYEDMYPEEQRSVDELGYAIPLRKER